MGLLGALFGGGDDKRKKPKIIRTPRGHILVGSDDQQAPPTPMGQPPQQKIAPWKQAFGQSASTRSKFWNSSISSKAGRKTALKRRHH